MRADAETYAAVRALVERTYRALSSPGGDLEDVFRAEEMTVAGSRRGELLCGREQVLRAATSIAARGRPWVVEGVEVWRRGDVAWAQVMGRIEVESDGVRSLALYRTAGVFTWESEGWRWQYWAGAELAE
jgi:hypothetical protein